MIEVDFDLLGAIHTRLQQLVELRGRLARLPHRLTRAQKAMEDASARVDQIKRDIQTTRMAADQKQLQLREREARIEDLKGKRNTCASNREYQLLSDQIAADQQANSVLEDEILELLERIDVLRGQQSAAEAARQGAETEWRRVQADAEQLKAQLEAQVHDVHEQLQQELKRVPWEIRKELERGIRMQQEGALAPVEGDSCGHCNHVLISERLQQLQQNQYVLCSHCKTILYLPEEARVPKFNRH